ncbi:hypothetical protein CRG98_023711, partial [Punica granatum]
ARPLFRDRKKFSLMVDPMLQGQYPVRGLYQALAIAAMCVQEQPNMRPAISDVVTALNYLSSQNYEPSVHSSGSSRISSPRATTKETGGRNADRPNRGMALATQIGGGGRNLSLHPRNRENPRIGDSPRSGGV